MPLTDGGRDLASYLFPIRYACPRLECVEAATYPAVLSGSRLVNASHNGAVRVVVDKVRLYFDVEGCGLAARGDAMVQRPALVLLHGGPGADHSFFKPDFSALADAAQVIYLDQRGSGRSGRGDPCGWTWSRWAEDVAAVTPVAASPVVRARCGKPSPLRSTPR